MSSSKRRLARRASPIAILALLVSAVLGSSAGAATGPVGLGTATSFAVLAGSGITNTGATTITGDIGTFPTPTITGLGTIVLVPPSINHADDAVTQGAKDDLQIAYDDAAGRTAEFLADTDFAGETLTPGVYVNGTLGLTGVLTLDFENDPTAQFVFKASSTLITGPGASIVMIRTTGNDACRVVWQVGSSATFDTTTSFVGDVLAHTTISAKAGATFQGRLLALNGAVTLINNTINRGTCASVPPATTTTTPDDDDDDDDDDATPTATIPWVTMPTTSTTSTTSTTAAPTTTTSVPALVVAPPPTSPPEVTGQQVPPPPETPVAAPPPELPELPRTGTSTLTLAITGALLVVLGSAAVRVEHRGRATAQG